MRSHGDFKLERKDRCLVFRVIGSVNLITVRQSFDAFKDAVGELDGEGWVCLNDLREWELFPPECTEEASNLNAWCAENGLTHEAVVVTNSLLKSIASKTRSEQHPVETRYFTRYQEAEAWLESVTSDMAPQPA
ncbi:hypothetical protein ACFSJ3_10065 [Corallincola platygyrae]|uniref:STAS/SEC14 domain-containing protein n=1 Tax=Corallincola platygyrae TaxID=1193278 RepID=A0ABW4XPV1_9GAMM